MRWLASLLLFPALVASITAFAVFGSAVDLAGLLGLAPEANIALLSLSAIGLFYTTVAALERVHPYRREWNRPAGDRRTDLLHLLFTGPLSGALFEATLRGVAATAAVWFAGRLGGLAVAGVAAAGGAALSRDPRRGVRPLLVPPALARERLRVARPCDAPLARCVSTG